MFESISIQSQSIGDAMRPLNMGLLAEAMLFYGRVELRANRTSLQQLLRECGPDVLAELLERGTLSVRYEPNSTGIYTENTGTARETHRLTTFEIERQRLDDVLPNLIIDTVGCSANKGHRLARRLGERIGTARVSRELPDRVAADMFLPDYVLDATLAIIRTYVPDAVLPAQPRFEVIAVEGTRFRVRTNFDFRALNELYHRRIPPTHSSLSSPYLLSHLLTARKQIEDSSQTGSEIATDEVHAALIAMRLEHAIAAKNDGTTALAQFQDLVFQNSRAVADAINSGSRTFRDLLPILDSAARFRSWLQSEDPSTGLVKSYFRDVTSGSWIERLPGKTVRWSIFTGAGLIIDALGGGGLGKAAALAVSVSDAFLLDRLVRGWKPTHFISGPLRRFVEPCTARKAALQGDGKSVDRLAR